MEWLKDEIEVRTPGQGLHDICHLYLQHTIEGPDDSPSHMRALLTGASESIPVDGGRLSLGARQGIYLCEHRRKVLIRCLKVK